MLDGVEVCYQDTNQKLSRMDWKELDGIEMCYQDTNQKLYRIDWKERETDYKLELQRNRVGRFL